MVVRSQRTKKASCCVAPSNAPLTHSLYRKEEIVCWMLYQSASPLGSKTAHWVP